MKTETLSPPAPRPSNLCLTAAVISAALTGALAVLLASPSGAQGEPTTQVPPELRGDAETSARWEAGRRIYHEGVGSSDIVAVLPGDLELEGSMLVCAGCHGPRGEGSPEGGLSPSDLRPHMLRRPYEVRSPSGRTHGPYDDRSLVKAIAMGLDPAGNRLQSAMPTYRMSRRDMQDLILFLSRLGDEPEPGVDEETLRIGVVVPPGDVSGAQERAVSALVDHYFANVADEQGVFGRRLERIEIHGELGRGSDSAETAEARLREADVLALVGGSPSLDGRWIEAAEAVGIPWIGPRSLDAGPSSTRFVTPGDAKTFYLEPGLGDHAAALAEHAVRAWPEGRALIALPPSPSPLLLAAAAAFERRRQELGGVGSTRLNVGGTTDVVAVLDGVDLVVLLTPGALGASVAGAAVGAGRVVLAPSQVAAAWPGLGSMLGNGQGEGLYLTAQERRVPSAASVAFAERWHESLQGRVLPVASASTTRYTLAAVQVLIEGLQRCGGDPTRGGLVRALEGLREHDTQVAPTVTFGPNRRIGFDPPTVRRLGDPVRTAGL